MHQPDHWIAASRSPFGLLGNACAQAHRHDREPVAPDAAGAAEVLAAVLHDEHLVAVVVDIAAALVPASALLGDREVEADGGAVPAGPVLLRRGEPRVVRGLHQQGRVGLGLPGRDEVLAAQERVEVVELDRLVAVVGAALDPAPHDRRQLLALGRGADVEHPLAPALVDDEPAVLVQDEPEVLLPEPLLVGLGLEAVDVAHRVGAVRRTGVAVADHDADVVGQGRVAAELVVEVRAGRGKGRVLRRPEWHGE